MTRVSLLFAASCCMSAAAGAESWNNPPKNQPAGVQHKTFPSASMKTDVGYCIYLPPGYADSADKRYPVVYYLHGRGGTESSDLFNCELLDKAIRDGKVPPMIYVHAMGGRNSGYVDSTDGKITGESVIIKELIPHIDATYRTVAAREGRGIQGFSKGGQGALRLAFKFPEMFGSAVGYGAGMAGGAELKKELPKVFKEMHDDDVQQFDDTSVWAFAPRNADALRAKLPIQMILGDKDQHLTRNRNMHKLLDELKVPHEYRELEGVGHDTRKVYALVGLEGFQFHAKHFGAPAAAEQKK